MENDRICAGKPNGSIDNDSKIDWFGFSAGGGESRDTVVPLDDERMRPPQMWAANTTIICNIAISVAAVNGL